MSSSSLSSPIEQAERPTLRLRNFLQAKLGHPRAAVVILLVSAGLMAFSLDTGLAADDYVHMWLLQGAEGAPGFARAPWDIFRFTTPETTPSLQAQGILSWWADPQGRLAFFRPVSALTHYVDHELWPQEPWLMHLHSLAWGVLALSAVLALYRRLLAPGWLLGLSFYLYALDDARCWFVSWVAGRNTVVATALSLWVLVFHVRGRQEDNPRLRALALLAFPVALLAGEGSLAICAYMFAHALFLESDAPRLRRLLRLWPYALVVVAWRIPYSLSGYGASRSGLYVDPGSDPIGLVLRFVERTPILLFSQLGGAWSDLWSSLFVFPIAKLIIATLAVLFVGLYAYLLAPQCRADRVTAFGLTGAALSLIPATAAFPADRLLNWIAVGVAPALARLIVEHLGEPIGDRRRPRRARIASVMALVLVAMHLVLSPPLLASRARGNNALRDILGRVDESVPKGPVVTQKDVIYINPPAVPLAAYLPIMRGAKGEPSPRSQLWLSTATGPVSVTRTGPRTLHVASPIGLLENPASQLLRSERFPFHVGQVVDVGPRRISVREVDEHGAPKAFDVAFESDLEDPHFVFLAWRGARYEPFALPAIGATVRLPAVDYFEVVFGHPMPVDGRHPIARTALRDSVGP